MRIPETRRSSRMIFAAVIVGVVAAIGFIALYVAERAERAERVEQADQAKQSRDDAVTGRGLAIESGRGPGPTYEAHRKAVEAHIEAAVREGRFGRHRLGAACARALRGGKRVRAVVALEVARAAGAPGGTGSVALEAAGAVEYLHAASLVVDDTPAFDNDATRRGAPALHVEVGEGVAQMAAVSLVAAAFRALADQARGMRARAGADLVAAAADAMGGEGAATGQVLDISSRAELAAEGAGVDDLVRLKTASFFELAAVAGWLAAGGAPGRAPEVRAAGGRIGFAFQVADDIGDAARDAARAAAGRGGWNYANAYGAGAAWRALEEALREGRAALGRLGLWSDVWEEIFALIVKMTSSDSAAPPTSPPGPPDPPAGEGEARAENESQMQ